MLVAAAPGQQADIRLRLTGTLSQEGWTKPKPENKTKPKHGLLESPSPGTPDRGEFVNDEMKVFSDILMAPKF